VSTTATGGKAAQRAAAPYRTSVGKKIAMAVTGVILLGFVIAHMIGNLKVYQGPVAFNQYAEGLRGFGAPFIGHGQALWIARLVLLGSVIVHIGAAFSLVRQSRAARAHGYKQLDSGLVFSYASRTMVWGGLIILAFVIYHLLHLTLGTVHPDFMPHNAYHNFVIGFQRWPVSLFYVLAMIPLGFHIYHGTWSALQTLGANNARYNSLRRPIALAVAWLVVIGNISFPVAVLTGLIG
jgi:succinate dehydrogenase / fumarate reductase, cytochrome b subunit